MPMMFKLLGPLEVEHDGVPIRLGGFRERTLLTMLLLEANRPVPLDRLVDAIWNDGPPASARNQVRICVCGLRRRLASAGGADLIETHHLGYRLNAPDGAVDVRRFEDLLARARASDAPERAVELYRAALGLWRGPVAMGSGSALVEALSAQLTEERLVAVEECVDLELRLGRHRAIVSEIVGHLAEHPFRERLCAQLMLGLYRSGRQAEALVVLRNTRARLADELGLEPGRELRTLEHAILVNDPRLDAGRTTSPYGVDLARPRQARTGTPVP